MTLPILVTFNDALTKLMESSSLYMYIQQQIVPVEIRLIALLLSPLPIHIIPNFDGFTVNGNYVQMTWNCIGWQSILLLLITLYIGLRAGSYTLSSSLEAVSIAVLGTFIMNLIRLSLIVIILSVSKPIFAIVYHDYLAAIFTIAWLFFFWWFAYKFVLEEKNPELKAI